LGHEFLLGDATAIRAACPRKQKTDKRDARHILKLLVEDRFPDVWQPPAENENLRQLLLHRCRMVRMRTRIKNQLDSIHPTDEDLSLGTPVLHPTDEDLSLGTPVLHPSDEDLSLGTPVRMLGGPSNAVAETKAERLIGRPAPLAH
jgi:hypothetical protein